MNLRRFGFPLLVIVVSSAAFLLLQPDVSDRSRAPSMNMPWDITIHDDGTSSVFGLRLETTRLGDALQFLGGDYELAIISSSGAEPALEAYFSHFSTGPLQAKLILNINADARQLQQIQASAIDVGFTSTGARKFRLDKAGVDTAMQWPIDSLTLIPAAQLDAEILRARFGAPRQTLVIDDNQTHWLYPQLGLDISLHTRGKEVLQYAAPRSFARLTTPLQRNRQAQ